MFGELIYIMTWVRHLIPKVAGSGLGWQVAMVGTLSTGVSSVQY